MKMPGLIDKRKRSREDDVLCESTPLSKRINNLHLSNFEETHYNQQLIHHDNSYNLLAKEIMESSVETSALKLTSSYESNENLYEPELDESQNPFYYIKNKLLHDLHLERLKRWSL